jgi:hypothetical protein
VTAREQMIAAGVLRPRSPDPVTAMEWIDAVTLLMDSKGRAAARKHCGLGPVRDSGYSRYLERQGQR